MKKLILTLLLLPKIILAQNYTAKGEVFTERTKKGDVLYSYTMYANISVDDNFVTVKTFDPVKEHKVPISKRVDTEGSIILDVLDRDIKTIVVIFATSSIVFYPVRDDDNLISFFYDKLLKITN